MRFLSDPTVAAHIEEAIKRSLSLSRGDKRTGDMLIIRKDVGARDDESTMEAVRRVVAERDALKAHIEGAS